MSSCRGLGPLCLSRCISCHGHAVESYRLRRPAGNHGSSAGETKRRPLDVCEVAASVLAVRFSSGWRVPQFLKCVLGSYREIDPVKIAAVVRTGRRHPRWVHPFWFRGHQNPKAGTAKKLGCDFDCNGRPLPKGERGNSSIRRFIGSSGCFPPLSRPYPEFGRMRSCFP